MLYPFSLVYALVVYIRNVLFDAGLLKSKSFETTTVCIGNLSVGGTGKTPMAEFLIRHLQKEYKLALLSRGYRRKSTGFLMADEKSTAESLGDEPFQIHSKFPHITVAVDADRRNGIRILEEKISPEIILLDDAFQHRKVEYGIIILLTAYGNLYVDDQYLPTGNLRDSKGEARRTDFIVVTKCPKNLGEEECRRITQKLNPKPHQEVLFSTLEYDEKLRGELEQRRLLESGLSKNGLLQNKLLENGHSSGNLSLNNLKNNKITLVTGIADPAPLVEYLEEAGLEFEHLSFGDHHSFKKNELALLQEKEFVLTTEKDFVRLQGKVSNLYYLPVRHRFLDEGEKILLDRIKNFKRNK